MGTRTLTTRGPAGGAQVRGGEDVVGSEEHAAGFALTPLSPLLQDGKRARVEINAATARSGLAGCVVERIADRDERSVDGQATAVEVFPAQPEELAAAETGVGSEPERREEPLAPGHVQESAELVGGPRAHG